MEIACLHAASFQHSSSELHSSPCAELVHRVDHGDDVIDRSFGQNAMAEIENMPGTAGGAAQNFRDARF